MQGISLRFYVQAEEAALFCVKMPVEFAWIEGPKS